MSEEDMISYMVLKLMFSNTNKNGYALYINI